MELQNSHWVRSKQSFNTYLYLDWIIKSLLSEHNTICICAIQLKHLCILIGIHSRVRLTAFLVRGLNVVSVANQSADSLPQAVPV